MEIVQKGGTLLETEDAFFEWLNKDSNIEDLLKSSLRFFEYKEQVAESLVRETMKDLDSFWQTKVLSRVKTEKTISKSLSDVLGSGKLDSTEYSGLLRKGYSIEYDAMRTDDESNYLKKLASTINQTQNLKLLYQNQRKYICETYFAKKSNPTEYKKVLEMKRKSIRKVVNDFIEAFTGDSNRRHRLFILNYAIDFAQNWTTFQANYKLNLIITGGAGLGKTTFAKAIGRLFFEFGLLARDVFQIREKTDFIAQYVGQTAPRTYGTLYSALESVLFIDEAYSVSGCGTGASYDYGQEFIDALVDVSQKTRGLISVIAAGYKAEIHSCFLDKNPGMRRRFPNEVELVPYSVIDLDNILVNNVLRPLFPSQLNTILKMDLLKEPSIYFQNPQKFQEFGKEITNRLPEIDPTHSMDASIYTNLLVDDKRADALNRIATQTISDYPTIIRFRTKVIGLYRFFLQLASFDTNYPSFEAMYGSHQYLWNLFTGNNPNRSYKYNNYRLMYILYLSAHQQKREILKSYLLRNYFSEKEGSLFPNQAGDMDTLAAFIKSQPNIRMNALPTLEEVTKLYNESFRSRGGSQFILRATKVGEKIDLFIYHVGGGFLNYTNFESSVLQKIFESLTYDQKDTSALWKLNSIPADQRAKIILNINKFYSQACIQILKDSHESLKATDSKEKNEKRLPSGIDIRFLEAEVTTYMSSNQGTELGDETKMKFLEFVSTEDGLEDDDQTSAILREITQEEGADRAPVALALDENELCRSYIKTGAVKVSAPPPPAPTNPVAKLYEDAAKRVAPSVPRSTTVYGVPSADSAGSEQESSDTRLKDKLKQWRDAAQRLKESAQPKESNLPAPQVGPPDDSSYPKLEGALNPIFPDGVDQTKIPPTFLRFYIGERKRFTKIQIDIVETKLNDDFSVVSQLPPINLPVAKRVLADGTAMYYIKWNKMPDEILVYCLKGSTFCSEKIVLYSPKKDASAKKEFTGRVFQLTYIGKANKIYPPIQTPIQFEKGAKVETAPVRSDAAPPPPAPTTVISQEMKDSAKKLLSAIYPPTEDEVNALATIQETEEKNKYVDKYKKEKVENYIAEHSIPMPTPDTLYFKGKRSNIQSFDDLVDKNLSLNNAEAWSLTVAKIKKSTGAYISMNDESGTTQHFLAFEVEFTYPGMEPIVNTFGLNLPKANALITDMGTTPWKFDLFQEEGEDENEDVEFGDSKETE